mgnify:CR=1 FL=1
MLTRTRSINRKGGATTTSMSEGTWGDTASATATAAAAAAAATATRTYVRHVGEVVMLARTRSINRKGGATTISMSDDTWGAQQQQQQQKWGVKCVAYAAVTCCPRGGEGGQATTTPMSGHQYTEYLVCCEPTWAEVWGCGAHLFDWMCPTAECPMLPAGCNLRILVRLVYNQTACYPPLSDTCTAQPYCTPRPQAPHKTSLFTVLMAHEKLCGV